MASPTSAALFLVSSARAHLLSLLCQPWSLSAYFFGGACFPIPLRGCNHGFSWYYALPFAHATRAIRAGLCCTTRRPSMHSQDTARDVACPTCSRPTSSHHALGRSLFPPPRHSPRHHSPLSACPPLTSTYCRWRPRAVCPVGLWLMGTTSEGLTLQLRAAGLVAWGAEEERPR